MFDACERAADMMPEAQLERLVLDPDDALVVQPNQQVETRAVRITDRLGQAHVRRARGVSEEVRSRWRIGILEPRLLFGLDGPEDGAERLPCRGLQVGGYGSLDFLLDRILQRLQLGQCLTETKRLQEARQCL